MKLRPANSYKVRACEKAESLLRAALMCASVADCPKLQGKIRRALASARGAVSHVRVRLVRTRPTYGVLHVTNTDRKAFDAVERPVQFKPRPVQPSLCVNPFTHARMPYADNTFEP